MLGGLRDLGGRLFPERQVLLRSSTRVRVVLLPGWLQALGIVACIATVGGVSSLAIDYFTMHRTLDRVIASEVGPLTELSSANKANAELHRQLATINTQYAALQTRYNAFVTNQSANATVSEQTQPDLQQKLDKAKKQLAAKGDNLTRLKKLVDDLHANLKRIEQARAGEKAHARHLEDEMRALTSRANRLKSLVDSKDGRLAKLRNQLDEPNGQAGFMPAAKPTVSSLAAEPQKHSGLAPHASVGVKAGSTTAQLETSDARQHRTNKLERILASTGVDIKKILHHIDRNSGPGIGGPFVSLDSMRSSAREKKRIAALLKIAKLLPLRSPLRHYSVGSPFGPRLDPFNHRAAFHPGLDLESPYRSPVYSTAPGVVIFTGWKGGYGRTVEIDHGHGIVTLYAHLHRILVARGEHVRTHVEIGQLGSTGRSTGPHLHYEIRLDGRPVNPEKFLEAGKNVVQASVH